MKALALMALLGFVSQSHADLTHLQKAARNAGWIAEENDITRMPPERFERLLGGPREELSYTLEEGLAPYALPPALDWRNNRGANWVGPIAYQGNCGSCVAFASIAVLESQYKIDAGNPGLKVDLSQQHLFSCGGGSCTWGWTPDRAANFLLRSGVPDEACFPYESGKTGSTASCRKTCADYPRRSVRLSSYSTPTSGALNIEAVKRALQNGPVVALFNLYDDFQYYKGGIYRHVSGRFVTGHAVAIIGYNDRQRYFIIRNSWGTAWGEAGFARVSYDDTSGLGARTWSYRVAP